MPLTIAKSGNKYLVKEPNGKVLGRHSSRKEAVKQIQAININKHKRRTK